MPQHRGHVVIHVRDLDRARAFYVDLLGWRERGPVGRSGVALGTGREALELVLQSPTSTRLRPWQASGSPGSASRSRVAPTNWSGYAIGRGTPGSPSTA